MAKRGKKKIQKKKSVIKESKINKIIPFKHNNFTNAKQPLRFGQKAADKLTKWAGSWTFIILVGIFIFAWIYLNLTAYVRNWDPWPFIILNLCLSCLAALQAPIILMSQNRQSERDRQQAEYDYAVNRKSEREIEKIRKQLNRIEKKL